MPLAFGEAPLSRPCTIDDTPPVKSISVRSACANAVGSSEAVRPPTVTLGWPPDPSEIRIVLRTPSKLTSCARSASAGRAAGQRRQSAPRRSGGGLDVDDICGIEPHVDLADDLRAELQVQRVG